MADLVIGESERICIRCGVSKPANLEFFSIKRPRRLNARCKACVREAGRLRWADPDYHAKELAKRAIRYQDPAFQEKERNRQDLRQADPSHIASEVARQKRRSADPDHQHRELERNRKRRDSPEYRARVREYSKKHYAANLAYHAEKQNAWYQANREKVREKRNSPSSRNHTNKWLREHLKKNPHLRVIRNVGVGISEILKEGRISGCFRFLPYSKAELRRHLERQFSSGMTWENYGTRWHVDHIVPQASFKIDPFNPTDCLEFQACWALTNLRPLWKHDNQVKSARRTHLL